MHSRRTRVAGFLLLSASLHVLAILVVDSLVPPSSLQRPLRVHRLLAPYPRSVPRLVPRPPVPLPRRLLERLRTEAAGPGAVPDYSDSIPPAGLPPEPAAVAQQPFGPGEKAEWTREADTLALEALRTPQPTELPIADPVSLDAMSRTQTVVVVDARSGKLKRAVLHIPAYQNRPDGPPYCTEYHGGKRLEETVIGLGLGYLSHGAVPVAARIHWFSLGGCANLVPGMPGPEPVHSFVTRPHRHVLRLAEMREYPFLHLGYIDVESLEALTQYLLDGGFAAVSRRQLELCHDQLLSRGGHEVARTTLSLGHPIYHSYFDITEYWGASPDCPALGPVPALEVDGRVVAVVAVPFVLHAPCQVNKLFANMVAYGLIQPGRIGARFRSTDRAEPASSSSR